MGCDGKGAVTGGVSTATGRAEGSVYKLLEGRMIAEVGDSTEVLGEA